MSRFTTYAIKEISTSFLFLVTLISGILWLGQGLRHIDLLTAENVSLASYISYVILLLPKLLLLTIPICTFLASLYFLNRLRNDSELLILWSSGKSEKDILFLPLMLFSIIIFFVALIISIYITPISLNEIRHKIIEIRSSGIHASILKERKFISPTDTLTIFLQEREGNEISGLLIHDLGVNDKPQTYIAQKGEFINDENKKILRLYNGNIQIFEKNESRILEVAFNTYDLDLIPYNKIENNHIYSDELLTKNILNNLENVAQEDFNSYQKEQFAELHSRFINPIYIFIFSLLPLLIAKFFRKPTESWILPVSIISTIAVIIQIIQITQSNLLVDYTYLIYANYFIPILFIIIILSLIFDLFKR